MNVLGESTSLNSKVDKLVQKQIFDILVNPGLDAFEAHLSLIASLDEGTIQITSLIIDILLYCNIRKHQPSIAFTSTLLSCLYKYQETLPSSAHFEDLLMILLVRILKCDPSSFQKETDETDSEIGYENIHLNYELMSRYLTINLRPPILIQTSTYLKAAHDTCIYLFKSEYVKAYQSLACLRWLHQENQRTHFSEHLDHIQKFIEQANACLSTFVELLSSSRLRWESIVLGREQ